MPMFSSSKQSTAALAPEGEINFKVKEETFKTWYKIYGDLASNSVPLVVLHGGPGLIHDYLVSIKDLEKTRPVIFYDQIGNGRSTHLPEKEKSFWTIDLFIDELINLIKTLGISSRYDVLGHSWGGMLASEFIIRRQPEGLRRLVIVSSLPSMELWNKSNGILTQGFPADIKGALGKGSEDMSKFRQALEFYYSINGCTLNPPPKEIAEGVLDPIFGDGKKPGDTTVNFSMKMPLHGWNIIKDLDKIKVPTLLLNGRKDIAQDFVVQPFFDRIPKVKWLTFENSSHTSMWEERERFMDVVERFLELED